MARSQSSSRLVVDVVVGVVDSGPTGSEADADPVGVVGSVLTLGPAVVVSTTGGTAARRVRGAGRGRWLVVSVGVGVSSAVGSAGAVTAGTRGAGRLIALFVVRGAGQRNSVDTTATAAAAPPMLTNAAGLRTRSTAGAGAASGSRSSASSLRRFVRHRNPPAAAVALCRQGERFVGLDDQSGRPAAGRGQCQPGRRRVTGQQARRVGGAEGAGEPAERREQIVRRPGVVDDRVRLGPVQGCTRSGRLRRAVLTAGARIADRVAARALDGCLVRTGSFDPTLICVGLGPWPVGRRCVVCGPVARVVGAGGRHVGGRAVVRVAARPGCRYPRESRERGQVSGDVVGALRLDVACQQGERCAARRGGRDGRGVIRGGGVPLGGARRREEGDVEVLLGQRAGQQFDASVVPRGGAGDRDPGRRAVLALGDPVHDPAHQPRRQLLRRPRLARQQHRDVVADPAGEPADHPLRLAVGPPLGRRADVQAAVGAEVQHRCDTAPAVAEIDRLDVVRAGPRDGRGRAGSTHVDPEDIAHRTPSLRSVARFAQAL